MLHSAPTPCYRVVFRLMLRFSYVLCRAMISLSARWSLLSRHTEPTPGARRGLSRGGEPSPQNLENCACTGEVGEDAMGIRSSGDGEEVGACSSPWSARRTWLVLAWVTNSPAPASSTVALWAVPGREAVVAGRGPSRLRPSWVLSRPS